MKMDYASARLHAHPFEPPASACISVSPRTRQHSRSHPRVLTPSFSCFFWNRETGGFGPAFR